VGLFDSIVKVFYAPKPERQYNAPETVVALAPLARDLVAKELLDTVWKILPEEELPHDLRVASNAIWDALPEHVRGPNTPENKAAFSGCLQGFLVSSWKLRRWLRNSQRTIASRT